MKRTVSESILSKKQKTTLEFVFDLLAEDEYLFQIICMHLPFQTFAHLARVNTFYRKLMSVNTPAKIEQWLEIHSHETERNEKVVYLSRANRMYVDNQITKFQFNRLKVELFPNNPYTCGIIVKKWSPLQWFDNISSEYELKKLFVRSRPPDEIILERTMGFTADCSTTLLCGYRPATIAHIFAGHIHFCVIDDRDDVDVSLFQKSCPDHILMSKLTCAAIRTRIYNTMDFAVLRTMPYFFELRKFIVHRDKPYTVSMISELGTLSDYKSTLEYSRYFPPCELIKWIHTSRKNYKFAVFVYEQLSRPLQFPCFADSIRYLMNNHCIDGLVRELSESGDLDKKRYKAFKDALETVNKNSS
jgi:hypothetical protein